MAFLVNPTVQSWLLVRTRSRARGVLEQRIPLAERPELGQLLLQLAQRPGRPIDGHLHASLRKYLRQHQILVPSAQAPRQVLLAPRLRRSRSVVAPSRRPVPLVLNPALHLQAAPDSPPPPVVGAVLLGPEQMGFPRLWVRHPGSGVWLAHLVPHKELGALVDGLRPSGVARLGPQWRSALQRVGALLPRGQDQRERRRWEARAAAVRLELSAQRYAVLRGLLPAHYLSALRRYYRALDGEGYLQHHDRQEKHRHVAHNEPVSRYLHHQLVGFLDRGTPERIKPSYSFVATYLPGSRLKRHVDRPQCAWNVSLLLDTTLSVPPGQEWPIYLEVGGKSRCVRLRVGDAVLYRGTEVPHWRPPHPLGGSTTLAFFHFVPADFTGPLT
jgi:hypothetical protein